MFLQRIFLHSLKVVQQIVEKLDRQTFEFVLDLCNSRLLSQKHKIQTTMVRKKIRTRKNQFKNYQNLLGEKQTLLVF